MGGFTPVPGPPFTASPSMATWKPTLHFVDVDEEAA